MSSIVLFSCGATTKITQGPETKDSVKVQTPADTFQFHKAYAWVNDFDSILTDMEEGKLDAVCKNYEKATTNQLVVATIGSFKPYSNIADYSTDMFNEWKIGTKEKNNGVLIVLCKDCHEVRITTGYGAEKILTTEICDLIVDPLMLSYFEKDKYYEGLKAGIDEIIKKWKE